MALVKSLFSTGITEGIVGSLLAPTQAKQEVHMTIRRLPLVREFMDTYVDTLSPETDIMEAVKFLLQKRVTGALVTSTKGELLGMLTELDCLKLLTLGNADHVAPTGKVKDFMTSGVQTIPPNMDIYYAAGLFLNVSFRRFPVVENGLLVGAITRFDILRAVQSVLTLTGYSLGSSTISA